ncbi:MAG: ribonuclease P protein component [Hydrococcus sp. C42_A2020_068]|uniref:ribonuclease P protein component n=1 Tax=Pleurocapsa sp. PCC 7327 TaxID=118163 RepID=UPI00029F990C|nr:ribonuclease P protein component [Pleurocapsa sp. PCC 7327]AFY76660.1 ribonuclease P protein component [Pleurocapsa sp. PCC 7327]MBF2021594.1 ribonuclease P protein component [Hydrococcus sp. C42_A2020_068]
MGLPKAHRLKHWKDFQKIYQQGTRYSSPHLSLLALSETKPDNSLRAAATRIGISVSQKVSKKAVIRNRIKRQIQAALIELLPDLSPGWKVVVAVRPKALECKYEHFLRELKQLLVEADIINGHKREYVL